MSGQQNTFSLEVDFLLGRSFSSTNTNRDENEWPPHPTRLFSALVAAYEEGDIGVDGREALLWLESLDPPQIYAELPEKEFQQRNTLRNKLSFYVPVNDDSNLPERRKKQPRWFPSIGLSSTEVWFVWKCSNIDPVKLISLQKIAENVTYLGTSMSPVRVRVDDNPPKPNLEPSPYGDLYIRVPGRGRLQHLEEIYNARKMSTYKQPRLGRVVPYSLVKDQKQDAVSSKMRSISLFQIKHRKIPPEYIYLISNVMKKAVTSQYPDPVPEEITGHKANGDPLDAPHMAVTPFLNVGNLYADGHIMGIGIWIPVDTPDFIIKELERACSRIDRLTLGDVGVIDLKRIAPADEERVPRAIRSTTYIGTSDSYTWASATPLILGKHPKKRKIGTGLDGGKVIVEMCRISGLPPPVEVRIGKDSLFRGSPKSSAVILPEKYSGRIVSHIWIKFGQPIKGPVLLGSGMYIGFGLLLPWKGGVLGES
ncbi:MAG: type I-U CRISPR-associated protein Csb2 [Thermoplasmatales archaeon]